MSSHLAFGKLIGDSSIVVGGTSPVFKIGSKFLIRIFFRTFYKNGFSKLVLKFGSDFLSDWISELVSALFTKMVIMMKKFLIF